VNQKSRPTLQAINERASKARLHFIERLNAVFTVLKNTKFQAFLHSRINCVEIVAP
jgi:hypothetical protein